MAQMVQKLGGCNPGSPLGRRQRARGLIPPRTEAAMQAAVEPGMSFPLGASLGDGGVNFSVFSKYAPAVQLLLFDEIDAPRPSRTIDLDPHAHRTYHYWHAFVPGVGPGQLYAYRAAGPFAPEKGLRFDAEKVLLDPYGRCIARPQARSRRAAALPGDNAATAYRSLVVDPHAYDCGDDRPPRRPFSKTVIYEMHVGNFTRHPNSGVAPARRGTFAGLTEKIPYLRALGITAIELLPIFAFDEDTAPAGRRNVWGYQPLSFFALHPAHSSREDPLGALDEFRDQVKALHRVGIELILDVVYNHTAEGGADGPTVGLRGLANETYYILGEDRATHADYTGTGNTLNANESIVRLDWSGLERHADVRRFAQHVIAFGLARTLPMEGLDITLNELLAQNPIEWHGVQLGEPDWGDTSHSLAATLHCEKERLLLHLMVNAYWEPLAFALPTLAPDHDGWRCCVDTFRVAPDDICPWAQAQAVHGGAFTVQPRSLAVLVAHAGPEMKAEEGYAR